MKLDKNQNLKKQYSQKYLIKRIILENIKPHLRMFGVIVVLMIVTALGNFRADLSS